MEHRRFGAAGRCVGIIGQGTWYIDRAHRASAIAALHCGIDLGMTHIDTAEYYGEAENIVGEAIAGRRDNVFLVSKVMPQNASRAGTIAACERSLKRLRTDHLDCYLLHWRGSYPLSDTFAGFAALKASGKILSWGVSNFDVADLEDAVVAGGENEIACDQVLYHLQERTIERAVISWCAEHNVAVVGYSPFGHDDFPSPRSQRGRVIEEIAAAHSATAHQVALAFLIRGAPLFTIPKASNPAHAAENAGAGNLRLSEREIALIDAVFPARTRPAKPANALADIVSLAVSRSREAASGTQSKRICPWTPERISLRFMGPEKWMPYSNPAPRAHLYFAASTSTGISVE